MPLLQKYYKNKEHGVKIYSIIQEEQLNHGYHGYFFLLQSVAYMNNEIKKYHSYSIHYTNLGRIETFQRPISQKSLRTW